MNNAEMSREFDIAYDNISSNQAPGLNSFEKSVILTKAQDDEVRSRYSPFNNSQKAFEGSENRRVELRELITPYSTTSSFVKEDIEIDSNSLFFEIPQNVYYILQEQVVLKGNTQKTTDTSDTCVNGTTVRVIPITHDEYNVIKDNPFRVPNKRKVWRMDIGEQKPQDSSKTEDIDSVPLVEIISEYDISTYKMRYLRQPSPIVLETFDDNPEYEGLDLSVDGVSIYTPCELNAEIHRNIVDRAVELAILGYRENNLQANVELNKRNI